MLVVVLLLFGRGKIPELMGDVAKGIKSFKKGLSEDDAASSSERGSLSDKSEKPVGSMADDKAAKG